MASFIPVTTNPNTEFEIPLDGQTVKIRIKWNDTDSAWYMDILGISFTLDIKSIKIVGGDNLLRPFAILELGQIWLVDLNEEFLDPDFDGFGDRYKLLYLEKADLE